VTRATCPGGCEVALVEFEPVDGADGYVLTHPDLVDPLPCLSAVTDLCVAVFEEQPAPDDEQFRLVAVDADGRRGTPSAPFRLSREP